MECEFNNHKNEVDDFLKNLYKTNPEGFNDLIRNLVSSDDFLKPKKDDAPAYFRETPEFIEPVARQWRKTVITEQSPMVLTDAYIRFDRAWNSYCACVLANMFGEICREHWHRTDQLGFLIDRKIRTTNDLDDQVHLMNLYRLLIPQFIDMNEEESNMKYENSWNKSLACRIVESEVMTPERIELLIRVREDFKRLPAKVSGYIKSDLHAYLNEQISRINPENLKDLDFLKKTIKILDNYIQWHLITENRTSEMEKKADACFELISKEIEKVSDIKAWELYCNLMLTGFAPIGTVNDRTRFMKRIETRLTKAVEDTKNAKHETGMDDEAFAERLMLASMYLENIFLEDKGCDIYTSYWALYHQNKMEEEMWRSQEGFY